MSMVRDNALQAFTVHMAKKLAEDIPILRAIREFEPLGGLEFMPVVVLLRDSIERGDMLSEAMDRQPVQYSIACERFERSFKV